MKRLGKTGPEPHTQLKLGVNEREPELYGGVYSFTQNSEKTKALEDFCPAPFVISSLRSTLRAFPPGAYRYSIPHVAYAEFARKGRGPIVAAAGVEGGVADIGAVQSNRRCRPRIGFRHPGTAGQPPAGNRWSLLDS